MIKFDLRKMDSLQKKTEKHLKELIKLGWVTKTDPRSGEVTLIGMRNHTDMIGRMLFTNHSWTALAKEIKDEEETKLKKVLKERGYPTQPPAPKSKRKK